MLAAFNFCPLISSESNCRRTCRPPSPVSLVSTSCERFNGRCGSQRRRPAATLLYTHKTTGKPAPASRSVTQRSGLPYVESLSRYSSSMWTTLVHIIRQLKPQWALMKEREEEEEKKRALCGVWPCVSCTWCWTTRAGRTVSTFRSSARIMWWWRVRWCECVSRPPLFPRSHNQLIMTRGGNSGLRITPAVSFFLLLLRMTHPLVTRGRQWRAQGLGGADRIMAITRSLK